MDSSAAQILAGDVRALARAATGLENREPRALEILRELAPHAGQARIVGITGPPGAGKSTLVDALAGAIRRAGKTIAVVAVDPSSRASGGAILGDRIRMMQHYNDPGIFIRSMATRGRTGGLARATEDLVRLMDASGKDYVVVETVGVGQDEVDVSGVVQATAVVLVPGAGDDVQAIKAGIMEIADVFVINKADLPGAARLERELRAALSLADGGENQPRIIRTVATEGAGIEELLEALDEAAGRTANKRGFPSGEFRLDSVRIGVANLDEALKFYESLGLTAGRVGSTATLQLGESVMELVQVDSPAGMSWAGREAYPTLRLRVPGLNAVVERLQAAGTRFRSEGGHVFVDPASAGGVLLELIQENDR